MASYKEIVEEIEKKIKSSAKEGSKPPCVTSNSDLIAMTQGLMNDPEHQVTTYTKKMVEKDGSPTPIVKQPSKRYRDSLKPVLKQMGIDKDELDKLDTLPLSKEHAAATMDLATHVIKDYITAGRRFYFPITKTDESQMSLSVTDIPERVTKPNRFVEGPDGTRVPQPTGKTVTTKAHKALKARNGVPFWLKDVDEG